MEALEYIEQQAAKNASLHLESLEIINKRAHTLVTLQIAGGGALGAFAMSMVEKLAPLWVVAALFIAAVWLFWMANETTRKCLTSTVICPPTNTPSNLLPGIGDLASLRLQELKQLDKRLQDYAQQSCVVSAALDSAYRRTAATPLWAAGAALAVLAVLAH